MNKYPNLKEATSQELLEAAVAFYRQHNPEAERWLRIGFALAGKDGWQQVAPAWLEDWRDNIQS